MNNVVFTKLTEYEKLRTALLITAVLSIILLLFSSLIDVIDPASRQISWWDLWFGLLIGSYATLAIRN